MPNLCQLADVKAWLSITDGLSDALLTRLIATTSQDFINTIRRPDLTPSADWTDNFFDYRDYWWIRGGQFVPYYSGYEYFGQSENRRQVIFLRHYPVNTIASVTLDDVVLDEVTDPTDLTQMGWWFDDAGLLGEDRQMFHLIGFLFAFPNCGRRMVVEYNGGYSAAFTGDGSIPQDIQQAVIEWIALKRGQSQLQSVNQSATGFNIGDYSQTNPISPLSLGVLEAAIPTSIQAVIDHYSRPVSF